MHGKSFGSICLFITAFIWGTAFVAMHYGAEALTPFAFNGIRLLMGAVVLGVFLAVTYGKKKKRLSLTKPLLVGSLVCGVVLFGACGILQIGMEDTTAGKAGFISALYILLIPLIQRLFGQKTNIWAWLSIAIATIGLFLLCVDTSNLTIGKGDILVFISAILYSLHILVIDRYVKGADPVELSLGQFIVAGILSLIYALLFEDFTWTNIMDAKWALLYGGAFSCGVAYTLQAVGQQSAEPSQASLIMSLESVFSAIASFILLGERFTLRETIGSILIFGAVLFRQYIPTFTLFLARIRNEKERKAV